MLILSSLETLIHSESKQVIMEESWIWLPPRPGISDKPFRVELKDVVDERQVGKYRADIHAIVSTGYPVNMELVIEVCVHSKCSQEKVDYFRQNNVEAVEILLPKSVDAGEFDHDLFGSILWGELNEVTNQRWLSFDRRLSEKVT